MMRTLISALAVLAIAGCSSTAAQDTAAVDTPSPTEDAPMFTTDPTPIETTTPTETTTSVPPVTSHLTKQDVTIDLKITSRQCFGSAGCNVEYEPRLTMNGAIPLDGTYDITYRVTGDESGPVIDTITLRPNGKYDIPWSMVSTPSSSTQLRAFIMTVEKF